MRQQIEIGNTSPRSFEIVIKEIHAETVLLENLY